MSRIAGKQLKDLTITSEKVDGSVLSTNVPARPAPGAPYNALGERIINVGSATGAADAMPQKDIAWRKPINLVATTDITPISGTPTIDSVSVTAGMRILLTGQTLPAENGVYVASAGLWTRATDLDETDEAYRGIIWLVTEGTVYQGSFWALTTAAPITIGVTPLAFYNIPTGGAVTIAGDVIPENPSHIVVTPYVAPPNAYQVRSVQSYVSVESAPENTEFGSRGTQAFKYAPYLRSLVADASSTYLYVGQCDQGTPDGLPVVTRFIFDDPGRVFASDSCYLTAGTYGFVDCKIVREIAQDSSYIYAATWDAGNTAIIDKATFSLVGWANFAIEKRYRVFSVAADDSGNFFVLGQFGTNRFLRRWSTASVLGQLPDNSVAASASLSVRANRVTYGGGYVWLSNGSTGQPSLRQVDPAGSMSILQTSTSTDAYSPAFYAFGSIWVVNWDTSDVLRIDPTNVNTIQATIAPPGGFTNWFPAFTALGPDENGTPDTRIWVSGYNGGYLVIDPATNTITSSVDGEGSALGEYLAPLGDTMYIGDHSSGDLVYARLSTGAYDKVTGNYGLHYGSTNANIVFRPGAPTIPGVQYGTWKEVVQQVDLVQGAAVLYIDDEDADGSFRLPKIDADLDGYDRLEIRSANRGYNGVVDLTIPNGFQLKNIAKISGNLRIDCEGTSVSPFALTSSWSNEERTVVFSENAEIRNNGTAPVYSIASGTVTFQFQSGAKFTDGSTGTFVRLTGAGAVVVIQQIDAANGATTALSTRLLSGTTGTASIIHDSQSDPPAQPGFSGAFNTVRLDHQELIQPSASAAFPSAPLVGQPHFYTTAGKNFWWNGSSWVTYAEGVVGDNLRATRATAARSAVLTGGRNFNYGDIGGLSYNYVSNLAMTTGTGTVAAVFATALLENVLYFAGSVGGTPGQLYKFDIASQVATFVTALSGTATVAPFGAVAADNPCDMLANENWLNGPLVAALTPKGLFVVYNPPTNAASGKQTIYPPAVADGFLGGRLASPIVHQFDGSKTGIVIATAPNEGKVYFADWNGTTGAQTSQAVGTTPQAICVDADQNVWIVDRSNGDILKFSVPAGTPSLTPIATYNVPDAYDICFDGRHIIVLSTTPTNGLTKLNPADGSVVLQVLDPAPYNDLWQFSSTALGTATARVWWDGEALWAFSNGLGYLLRVDPDTLQPQSNVASVSTGSTYGFCAPNPGISIYADGNSLKSATSHMDGTAAFSSIWRLDTPLQLDNGGTGVNGTVRVATTANINLTGNQTIDGVTTVNYDRVLVKNQTNPAENGVYIAKTGAWYRVPDFAASSQMYTPAEFRVTSGTTQANTTWELKNEGAITVGTTSLTFMKKVVDNTYKQAVRVASTANIVTLSGLLTVDGVTVAAGDRVLVKDQSTASQNGIYVAASGAWTRAVDFSDASTVYAGVAVTVTEGSTNLNSLWQLTTSGTIVVGTTSLTFARVSQAMISVTNLTALGAYNVTGLVAGTLAYVSSLRTLFRLGGLSGSPDGITIITALGGAASWFRLSTPLDTTWGSQATWFIDPASGNDENTGIANGAPIKTWAEFCRRVPIVNVAMTVDFIGSGISAGSTTEWLVGSFKKGSLTASLIVRGTLISYGSPNTASSFTDPVQTSGSQSPGITTGTFTSGGISGNDGKLLRSTTGGVETFNAILNTTAASLPASSGYVSWWCTRTSVLTAPATNTSLTVYDCSTAPTAQIRTEGFVCRVENFHFTDATAAGTPFVDTGLLDEGGTTFPTSLWGFYACIFEGNIAGSPGAAAYVVACSFTNATPGNNGRINPMGGSLLFIGGGSRRLLTNNNNPGRVVFTGFIQYGQLIGFGSGGGATAITVEVPNANYPMGVFASASDGLIVRGNATLLRATSVFGGNPNTAALQNAGYGLKVDFGAQATFSIASPSLPTLTGTSGDLVLSKVQGGATGQLVPIVNGIPTGALTAMTTWATWGGATFNRYAVNLCDGARVTQATGI